MSDTSDVERLMNQRIEFAKKLEIATSEKCAILSALEAKNEELMQLHCTINTFDQILMSYGIDMEGHKTEGSKGDYLKSDEGKNVVDSTVVENSKND